MIPLRHRRLWLAASALLVAATVFASLAPDLVLSGPEGSDKIGHFATYCGLVVWFTGFYPRTHYWKVVAGVLALSLGLEIAQGVMQLGRSAELLDMVANAAGMGVGLLLAFALTGNWACRIEAWLKSN
jgi:VanZ family protein